MLLLFCLHILITAISTFSGFLFYLFIRNNTPDKALIFYPITGLIILTLISQIVILFIPLSSYFFLSMFSLLILLLLFKRKDVKIFLRRILTCFRERSVFTMIFIILSWLMILVINAGPITMDDTESYHIQMVKWINEYGTVPGIANLHERFGFNSSWFSSISFFLPFRSSYNLYTVLNGALSLWISAFLIWQVNPVLGIRRERTISSFIFAIIIIFLLMLFCWPMIRGNAATANYDFITTSLMLILFIKSFNKQVTPSSFEWIMWPVYLFTVRIINCPLLILSLYGFYMLIRKGDWKKVIVFVFLCFFLIAPFVFRNVILSGYPFYPTTLFNIFNVDWKISSDIVKRLLDYIKYFNRVNVTFMDINQTKQLRFPNWLSPWFQYLFKYDKPVVIIGMLGYLGNIIFIKRFLKMFNANTKFFVFALFLQFILWIWIAPDPRFCIWTTTMRRYFTYHSCHGKSLLFN